MTAGRIARHFVIRKMIRIQHITSTARDGCHEAVMMMSRKISGLIIVRGKFAELRVNPIYCIRT
jgi:hypothetical protein